MRYQCPKCHGDNLTVDVTINVRLCQRDNGEFETDDVGNDHEWSDTSPMQCMRCNFVGEAHEFDTENEDE